MTSHVEQPSVLLVEDSRLNRALALRQLEALGCRVTVAVDGPEAVLACDQERFDIVLMDCELPTMDGYSATAAIRHAEASRAHRACIMAVTGHVAPEVGQKATAAGMDGLLSKPLELSELRKLLTDLRPQ